MPETPETLLTRLLEIESRAARLEGAFAADPELGRMWRGQVALTEACRSVGLEDIHVFEGDVIHRHLENRMTDAEGARGAAAVAELMRVIVAPGDLAGDPARVMERCWRAAVSVEDAAMRPDLEEIGIRIARDLGDAPTPLMGAIRAAAIFRAYSESSAPSADRLVFMAADHALRAGQGRADPGPERPEALLRRLDAAWILTPSIALTQERFRAWSPGSPRGLHDLLEGLSRQLDRAVGALPLLRRWRTEAQAEAAGRHGKSRLRDLVELAMRDPILTSAHVRRMLGVSERSSLYLMDEAQRTGILTLITPRKTHRVWAQPQMASLLRLRASRITMVPAGDAPADAEVVSRPEASDEVAQRESTLDRADRERSVEAAMAEMDAAMAKADAILAKYAKGGSR